MATKLQSIGFAFDDAKPGLRFERLKWNTGVMSRQEWCGSRRLGRAAFPMIFCMTGWPRPKKACRAAAEVIEASMPTPPPAPQIAS